MQDQPTLWPWFFKSWAKNVRARTTHNLLGRESVSQDPETEKILVNFLPSRDGGKLAQLPQSEVGPAASGTDRSYKSIGFATLIILPLSSTLRVIFPGLPSPGHQTYASVFDRCSWIIALVAFALLVMNSIPVAIRLNWMDTRWQNGISRIFEADTRTRMKSVQDILAAFRGFVKWRRYMSYLIVPAWIMLIVQIPMYIWQTAATRNRADGLWQSGILDFAILFIEFLSIATFSFLRWYFTDQRDPTLHLNVMIAEDFRAVEAARNRQRI